MSFTKFIFLLVSIASFFCITPKTFAHNQLPINLSQVLLGRSNLDVTIGTAASTFRLGQRIEVRFAVINNGKTSSGFCTLGTPMEKKGQILTHNCFDVLDANGEVVPYKGSETVNFDQCDKHSIRLSSGKFKLQVFDLNHFYQFSKAGTYTIRFKKNEANNLPASNLVRFVIR